MFGGTSLCISFVRCFYVCSCKERLTLMPWRVSDVRGRIVPSRVLGRVRRGPVCVIRVRDKWVEIIDRHSDRLRDRVGQICHCRGILIVMTSVDVQ
jgi:hypothetical protein